MGIAAAKRSAALLLSALVAASVGCAQAEPAPLPADAAPTETAIAPTPTATPTPTPAPTPTPMPTATSTPPTTVMPTATPLPTATPTPRPTATPTATPHPTATPRPTATPTPLPTPTPTPNPNETAEQRWLRGEFEVRGMDYSVDSFGWADSDDVWYLLQLAEKTPTAFQVFVEWVNSDVAHEKEASRILPPYSYLARIDRQKEQIAIASLEWAKSKGMWFLLAMARNAPSAFDAFVEWSRDKTHKPEIHRALDFYMTIALENEENAISIIKMPFLDEVTYTDLLALGSLKDLESLMNAPDGGNYLEWTLAHPTLEGGITDSNAVLVAYLFGMTDLQRSMAEILLDPLQTTVERRLINLPYTGEVELSVIRHDAHLSQNGDSLAMEYLEHSVRVQEEFMRVPFPNPHAAILLSDAHPGGGRTGHDAMIDTPHENLDVIAHAVAYSYCSDVLTPVTWIELGCANFLQQISIRAYLGASPLPPQGGDEGIFQDLYARLGDEAFRRGFRNLYYAINLYFYYLIDEYDAIRAVRDKACPGEDNSACHVRLAFTADATPEQAAIVDDVLTQYGVAP